MRKFFNGYKIIIYFAKLNVIQFNSIECNSIQRMNVIHPSPWRKLTKNNEIYF